MLAHTVLASEAGVEELLTACVVSNVCGAIGQVVAGTLIGYVPVFKVNVQPVPELKLGPASERAVSVETEEVNVSLNRFDGGPFLPVPP